MPERNQVFLLAIVALYVLAQALPSVEGRLQLGDLQWPYFDPDCATRNSCESMTGINLSLGGLLAFLVVGMGFYGSPLAEMCWLANPLFLVAVWFFVAKKYRKAAWTAGCAVIAVSLMLLPATSYDREGHAMFGHLEIGYWCWLGSIGALFIVSMLADRRTADRHRNIDTRVLDERTSD